MWQEPLSLAHLLARVDDELDAVRRLAIGPVLLLVGDTPSGCR